MSHAGSDAGAQVLLLCPPLRLVTYHSCFIVVLPSEPTRVPVHRRWNSSQPPPWTAGIRRSGPQS